MLMESYCFGMFEPVLLSSTGLPWGLDRGEPYRVSGGALLSHTLSGAVPSPCRALASGFGMGPGVSPWPWPPQILSTFPGHPGDRIGDGPGTGQWTRKNVSCTHSGRSHAVGNHPKDAIRHHPETRMMEYDCLSPVSTGRLHPLRGFHVRPIDHVFYMGATGPRPRGILILEQASRLDAFSGYPFRT